MEDCFICTLNYTVLRLQNEYFGSIISENNTEVYRCVNYQRSGNKRRANIFEGNHFKTGWKICHFRTQLHY